MICVAGLGDEKLRMHEPSFRSVYSLLLGDIDNPQAQDPACRRAREHAVFFLDQGENLLRTHTINKIAQGFEPVVPVGTDDDEAGNRR